MKKIFAVTQVQNGADVIESLCRYYCSFCDGIVITNNFSTDRTQNILNSLIKEGLPIFFTYKYNNPREQFLFAIDKCQADIILPADADEFLINTDGGNPRVILESLDEKIEYHIPCRNYTCPAELKNNSLFYPSNVNKYSKFSYYKTVMSRFLIKNKGAMPDPGRHYFMYLANQEPEIKELNTLYYNHYPIRNRNQFLIKAIMGWVYYLSYPIHDGSIRLGESWQWRDFFNEIKKTGTVTQEQLERCSAYTGQSLPTEKIELFEEPFNTSFCKEKLNLKYTNYNADSGNERFLQMLTTQLEYHLRGIPYWRADMERKEAGELLTQANKTIVHLNDYIQKLHHSLPPINKIGTFYFDTGNNFNENEIFRFNHEKDKNNLYVEVDLPLNIKSVRFDPVEGCGCFLQNLVILSDLGISLDYQITNGFNSENNGIVFTTDDPQILIDVSKVEIKNIKVYCNIWFVIVAG